MGLMDSTGEAKQPGAGRAGTPTHELVYRALRERILFGEMAPGQAVTIQGLTEELSAGMTPVREAIRRLIAEGALTFQGNRRVSVPVLEAGHIDELIFARSKIDPELALRASQNATDANIADLEAEDAALDRAIARGDLRGYLEHNFNFHARLYAMANAPILAAMAESLWLRFGPSLRVVCGRIGTQNLPDRHHEALAGLRSRNHAATAQAIRADVVEGMEQVRQAWGQPEPSSRLD